jgi:hypothetical protein
MRGRISNKTKKRFKNAMRDVIKGLSRRIEVYKQPIRQECPNCYYDKFTNKSTGKCKWTLSEAETKQAEYALTNPGVVRYKWFRVGRCPICRGKGYLEVRRKTWVDCLVVWNPRNRGDNENIFTPAGMEGATIVQLKTDPRHNDLFKDSLTVVIDDVECRIAKPPEIRGLGNQSILVVTAFTANKPKKGSNELLKDYS